MKEKIIILIISAIFTVGIAFYLFNFNPNLVGYVVYEQNSSVNLTNSSFVTKDIALSALNDSEKIIGEMVLNNFSITFVNDTLIEAKKIFEQAKYADILRGITNASSKERLEAVQSLKIVNWKNIYYSNVIEYTNRINERLPVAFSIYDSLNIVQKNLKDARISEETKQIFEKAKTAFNEDRYEDSQKLIEDVRAAIEKDKSENSSITGLKNNALSFFQKYWLFLLTFIIILGIIGYFIYKKVEKKILFNKIKKMKAERIALSQLIIKNQTERFKENKISALVYNIRDKKYKERIQTIEQELPVLELRLRKDLKKEK